MIWSVIRKQVIKLLFVLFRLQFYEDILFMWQVLFIYLSYTLTSAFLIYFSASPEQHLSFIVKYSRPNV